MKNRESRLILELKRNIANEVAPTSDKKVQNFWRRLEQFYVVQQDFKEFIISIVEDELLIGTIFLSKKIRGR